LDCRVYARAALELFEQTRTIAKMEEPDYAKNPSKASSSNSFFDPKLIKAQQDQAKTIESHMFMQEMNESGRVITQSQQKAVKMHKFGQFGTKLKDFNPFAEDF
jgi:Trk K+ transport system NAD-binding subunit